MNSLIQVKSLVANLHYNFIVVPHKILEMSYSFQNAFSNFNLPLQTYCYSLGTTFGYPHQFFSAFDFNIAYNDINSRVSCQSPPSTPNSTFEIKIQPSIIIRNSSIRQNQKKLKKNQSRQMEAKSIKSKRKPVQKQSRNVTSNIMRIFFKSILELRFYQTQIQAIIRKKSLQMKAEEFYEWLQNFGINFKNYIRCSELKKIMTSQGNQSMKLIFRILLNKYVQGVGLSHCLTSRRIDKNATNMHLKGLKELYHQILGGQVRQKSIL